MSESTIRVAVNLLWCVPGEVGGSEEYLVRQLLGLRETEPEIDVTIFATNEFAEAHPELCGETLTVTHAGDGRSRARRVITEHTWLARQTRGFDVVHHGGGTTPAVGSTPIVLTIHDLQYTSFPEYHSVLKLRYLRATMPRSTRRATIITTPTEWVRATVVDQFQVDEHSVLIVQHGTESTLGDASPDEDTLRRQYGLGSGAVLVFPAITHPHKGHEFLLEVMADSWHDPQLRLVLLGGAGRADADVTSAVERLGLGDRVVRPGRVPDGDRDGLIAMADALVFPSEYEGFGAPVVEAMALGTPVVAADQAAVAEVVGDAGVVLPRTLTAWRPALERIATQRDDLVLRGRRRAERFTAARSGAALASAYRAAVSAGETR